MAEWMQWVLLLGIFAVVFELGVIMISLGNITRVVVDITERLADIAFRDS